MGAAGGAQTSEEKPYEPATDFGRRNQYLAAIIPDLLENAVDQLLPDSFEAVLDRRCEKIAGKYQNFKTDVQEGIGQVAAVLFRVAKYAYEKFHIHDLVFGVYHLALHHATVDAVDAVEGTPVDDAALITYLIKATDAAAAAYCPVKKELCAAAGIQESDLLIFEPETTTTRPAYALWVDAPRKRLIWAFRGTTDLNDMLTDACASCTPYAGGYAHWGMLEAATWFAEHELKNVKGFLDKHPGYELLLVGHSLGAGTAAMLAHLLKNDPEAKAVLGDVKLSAVGVATPAVLTEKLADSCSDYITSVVLMHDVVPRFSIHNVFAMKEEMDATRWGDILAATIKDWAVPDVIENSETYKKLAAQTKEQACAVRKGVAQWASSAASWGVSMLHFAGVVKPNPDAKQDGKGAAANIKEAAAATAETARAAMTDAHVVSGAMQEVQNQMANVAMEDVHQVFAPGRLFFIRRLDKYKGRAKYGNIEHRCVLCENDDAIPRAHHHHTDPATAIAAAAAEATTGSVAAAAADAQVASGTSGAAASTAAAAAAQSGKQATEATAEFYPGAEFELIEAAPKQRFTRIVLRETCLMDHLCGGYVQGLRYALTKTQAMKTADAAAAAGGK